MPLHIRPQKKSVASLTSNQAKTSATHVRNAVVTAFFLVVLTATMANAQDRPQVFALPDARAGEVYRANIEDVLREKYGLRLEAGSPRAIVLWSIADGKVPAGISVCTDGTIVGIPTDSGTADYSFRLKAVDVAVKNEDLILNFTLAIKPASLRLTKIAGPRLVAVDNRTADADTGTASPGNLSKSDRTASRGTDTADTFAAQAQDAARAQLEQKKAAKEQEEVKAAIPNPISSLNKRFIVGFEQTGAAAADSTGKPFFDIFINTPLSHRGACLTPDCLPRFSIWGDVRLTTTATQVNALANVASTAVTTITGGKVNQLASAFDFTVGPELRLAAFNNTHLSLITGFGAVSPISPKDSVQIFQVPNKDSSQAARFFEKYPGAKDKDQIAFISPDRDRFLRQYFGGFRFKTYNTDNCGQLEQTFPATFDVTFGQNEAITEGRFHKFVVGFDGFYPLPFPDKKRFLYLFGSARLKAGGPKNHDTPFILDTAASSVKITDPKVFIADPTPTNRDTWRIGFGVDLFELFKFAKDEGAKQGENNALNAKH